MNYFQLAIALLNALLDHLNQISAFVQAAGDKPLTPDQWASVTDSDNKARAALNDILSTLKPPEPPAAAP
jgi:hypothetical protein